MSKEVFDILSLISSYGIVIPIWLAILKYNRLQRVQVKLFLLMLVTFVIEISAGILWNKKINNLPLYHFYAVIEFLLIVELYEERLSLIGSKLFFRGLRIAFILFAISNAIWWQDIFTFNSNVTTILGVLVICFALGYFYTLLKEIKYEALETNPMFWINSGFLMYFSSNLILFFVNNTLFKNVTTATTASYMLWGLHAIINIILIMFYTIAIWIHQKKQLH
ncbi:hypothetical protein [Aquimarina rhabdastrellae]